MFHPAFPRIRKDGSVKQETTNRRSGIVRFPERGEEIVEGGIPSRPPGFLRLGHNLVELARDELKLFPELLQTGGSAIRRACLPLLQGKLSVDSAIAASNMLNRAANTRFTDNECPQTWA